MKNYLLVDARGAFEAASARLFYDLARGSSCSWCRTASCVRVLAPRKTKSLLR
jgi:hypothetical protein